MYILINADYMMPVETKIYEEDPMSIFGLFYTAIDLDERLSFSHWLSYYIRNHIPPDATQQEMKKQTDAILKDKNAVKVLLTSLFPLQYEFTLKNWEHIQSVIQHHVKVARGKTNIQLHSFPEHAHLFRANINKALKF